MTAELADLHNPPIDPDAVDAVESQTKGHLFWLYFFVIVPLLAVVLAIPLAWGGFVGPVDIVLLVAFYSVSAAGITVGFHRHFTHGAFKAKTWVTGHAGRRRQLGHRRTVRPVGGRPP